MLQFDGNFGLKWHEFLAIYHIMASKSSHTAESAFI